jgi:hypothetical protein
VCENCGLDDVPLASGRGSWVVLRRRRRVRANSGGTCHTILDGDEGIQ